MARISVGQVENLQELVCGLESVRQALEDACLTQITAAEARSEVARNEARTSMELLTLARQNEQNARHCLESTREVLDGAVGALSACEVQPPDEDGNGPDCSKEEAHVRDAEVAVAYAEEELAAAVETLNQMERRVELANGALALAEQSLDQIRQECAMRLNTACAAIETGKARLAAAQRALEAYLATCPPAAEFYSWLRWRPEPGRPVTPDVLRGRMNISSEQRYFLQQYLYDRNPAYRVMVDKYRGEWAAAGGDVERNMVNRKARIHLSGEFAEQIARHALAPLGGKIETQGRTYVGEGGRYTKTDLIVTDLRVPVVLGRGQGMGAPAGGSMAVEVKCGKAEYLYAQKEHMEFQAEGHKQADAHCTLCSRDIHDLSPEKEEELREALRKAGSPMVGMLPAKNDIDQTCLEFMRQGTMEEYA